MEIQDSIIYIGMILTVGISMLVLAANSHYRAMWKLSKLSSIPFYLFLVIVFTIIQWGIGGGLYFVLNFLNLV